VINSPLSPVGIDGANVRMYTSKAAMAEPAATASGRRPSISRAGLASVPAPLEAPEDDA
jgi:hypothetical protein